MKLMLYDVDFNSELDFESGHVLSVECESKDYFAQLVSVIKGHDEGHIAIYDGLEQVNFEKDALTIIDFFVLEEYEKSILTKLYKKLDKEFASDGDVNNALVEIATSLKNLANIVTSGINASFDIKPPENLADYLKFVSLSMEGGFSRYNGLINLVSAVSLLKTHKVLIFVNAKSFFNNEQLVELIKCCTYNRQKVLFLDNRRTERHFNNEIKVLIDEDFYDILYK